MEPHHPCPGPWEPHPEQNPIFLHMRCQNRLGSLTIARRRGAGSHTPTHTGWWIRILGWDWGQASALGGGSLCWARLAAQVSQRGRDFQNQGEGLSAHRRSSNPEPR